MKKKIILSTVTVIIITVLSRVSGFIRDALIAMKFGATYLTDSYNIALVIPNIFFNIIGVAITTSLIPILTSILKKKGQKEMFLFSNSVIMLLFLISSSIYIFSMMNIKTLVSLIAPMFNEKQYTLTLYLVKVSMINVVFMSVNSVFTGMLQTLKKFFVPAFVGFVVNLPIIFLLLFYRDPSIEILMKVTVLGFFLQIVIQLFQLLRCGYRFKFMLDFRNNYLKKLIFLVLPVLIGTGVNQINTVVDRIMASQLPEGSIASLDFANKLSTSIYAVFAYAIITVMYPTLASLATKDSTEKFKNTIINTINTVNMVTIPIALILFFYRTEIVTIIFYRGEFDEAALTRTILPLYFLSIGIIFWGIRDICNRAFYALNDTKTPMLNGIAGVIICIFLNILMVPRLGIIGLALSAATSAFVTAGLLYISLNKRLGSLNNKLFLGVNFKIILSSFLMIAFCEFIYSIIIRFSPVFLTLVLSVFVSLLIYSILLYCFKVKELTLVFALFKKKFKKEQINKYKGEF